MLRPLKRRAEDVAAIDRVREMTRAGLKLAADTAIMVSEVSCALPGCPPRHTVVAFWTGNATRHQFKVFKPAAAVADDDIPPFWMKDALAANEWAEECC